MKSINTGYKFIAIVSLSYALFSCSSSVESQLNSELLAKLTAIEAKIDTLTGTVDAVQTTVLTTSAPAGTCSLQEVIDRNYANCDPGMIPNVRVLDSHGLVNREKRKLAMFLAVSSRS